MTLNRTNIVLASLLVLVVILTAATRVDYSQPNFEILPDMKYTPAWMAYTQNPVLANKRTLQAPVPGTIARGQLPLHFTPSKEDALRAGEEIANPYHVLSDEEATKLQDSIQRGGESYRIFCISCHGPTGDGDGPVTKRGFPPPPSLKTGKSKEMKDGQLFHILTYGQATMPNFAAQISRDGRWDLINYLRTMQPNVKTPSAEASNVEAPSEEQPDDEQAKAEVPNADARSTDDNAGTPSTNDPVDPAEIEIDTNASPPSEYDDKESADQANDEQN